MKDCKYFGKPIWYHHVDALNFCTAYRFTKIRHIFLKIQKGGNIVIPLLPAVSIYDKIRHKWKKGAWIF
jgi:hypothetical protein